MVGAVLVLELDYIATFTLFFSLRISPLKFQRSTYSHTGQSKAEPVVFTVREPKKGELGLYIFV